MLVKTLVDICSWKKKKKHSSTIAGGAKLLEFYGHNGQVCKTKEGFHCTFGVNFGGPILVEKALFYQCFLGTMDWSANLRKRSIVPIKG